MSWWSKKKKGPAPAAPSEGPATPLAQAEPAPRQDGDDTQRLRSIARALVMGFRHLAVHSPFPEVQTYRPALDDLDGSLRDGVRKPDKEFRKTTGAVVQEVLRQHRSREQLRTALLAEVTRLVTEGNEQSVALRTEIDSCIDAIQVAIRLDDFETMVEALRDQVWKLNESIQREREILGQRDASLEAELDKVRGDLVQAEQDLAEDPLTGVASRRCLDEFMERAMPAVGDDEFCLIMMDLDRFKDVNDTYGHDAGDEVLKAVGRSLYRVVLRKKDFVCRYGGEEFVVMLNRTGVDDGAGVAERLRQELARLEVRVGDAVIGITASFGVAASRNGEDAKSMLQRADRALYRAKQGGRDLVEIAEDEE